MDATIQPHTTRRYYIDWLRVLLILLVFYVHSAMPFNTGSAWAIMNDETSFPITAFIGFCYQWALLLFFLISGAGVGMSFRHRRAKAYLKERFLRICLPMWFGLVCIMPLQEFWVRVHQGLFGGSFLAFIPHYFAQSTPRFSLDFGLNPGHLWFLKYLFLYCVMALPIILVLETERGRRFVARTAQAFQVPGPLFICVVPMAVVQGLLRAQYHAHKDWSDFWLWFVLFLYGYFYGVDRRFEDSVRRHGWVCLGLGLALFGFIGYLFKAGYVETWEYTPSLTPGYVGYEALRSANSWCWTVFFLSMGIRVLDRPHRWLGAANEAVLPFYILHHPIVIIIAFYVVQWDAGIALKHAAITLPALSVTITIYLIAVRPWNPVRFLFGMRRKTLPAAPLG